MSLHDIMTQRMMLANADPFKESFNKSMDEAMSSMQALALHSAKLAQAQIAEEQKANKEQEAIKQRNKEFLSMKSENTNSRKLNGMVEKTTYNTSTGKLESTWSTPSQSELKSEFELQREKAKASTLDGFVNGNVSEIDLITNMSKLGVSDDELQVAVQAKKRIRDISSAERFTESAPASEAGGKSLSREQVPEGYYPPEYTTDKFGNRVAGDLKPISISDRAKLKDMEDAEKANKIKSDMVRQSAKDTIGTINEIRKGIDNFGVFGDVPSLPGTDRYNWESNFKRLIDMRVVALITEMKSASKTGATGFGPLSEKEGQRLENAQSALKRGLKKEDALRYLNEIEELSRKVLNPNREGKQTKFDYLWNRGK
jgi:hypothetical protein